MGKATSETSPTISGRIAARLLGSGGRVWDTAVDNALKSMRFVQYNSNAWFRGSVFPAADAVLLMNRSVRESLLQALRGEKDWTTFFAETNDRFRAGSRYERLVNTIGKELFGSATFANETVLAEDEFFRLSYLPPTAEEQPVAIFHAGGSIPYGDRIFRLTADYNFYDRFLERGIPVYAMELRADRNELDASGVTIERLVDSIQQLSDVAFVHNSKREMVLEGYCGHGTQALAYLAAKPEDAERKFHTYTTFVSPIDGTSCTRLADSVNSTPELVFRVQTLLWRLFGGYVPGDALRLGLDTALEALFHKTALGYFSAGWMNQALPDVKSPDRLVPRQQLALAGAYWVSPDCARRFPVPLDISKFTTALFSKGIAPDGTIPYTYRGETLSLARVVEETDLRIISFFGGLDEVVPAKTASILVKLFGERYMHVVHPWAGHISYVLSPQTWSASHPKKLDPNPIDLLL